MTTLPPFTVHKAQTVAEAGELLDRLGDDAVIYCGGTELLLVYRFGFADQSDLVDIKPIEELRTITVDGDELRIGATATHREIERSPLVLEHVPALAAMERGVGNVRVRNQGTIGGNLCFADPHSDPATFLVAAGGAVSARRRDGSERRIPSEEFVLGAYETALEPDELMTAVHVPRPGPGTAIVHRKLAFHERPTITVAVAATVTDGHVSGARVAVGAVGVIPVCARETAEMLIGLDASDPPADVLADAADRAVDVANPVADADGSVEYKRQLVRVFVRRAVAEAIDAAARA